MDEEVNQDKNGEADDMNLAVDSKDEVMHIVKVLDAHQYFHCII